MSKKEQPIYPPLRLARDLLRVLPDVWDFVDRTRSERRDGTFDDWAPWCYIPVGYCLSYVRLMEPSTDLAIQTMLSWAIQAVASWRPSKETFIIDKDLMAMLSEQIEDVDISPQIFMNMPYQSYYIDFNGGMNEYHGAFINLDHDIVRNDRELRVTLLPLDRNRPVLGFPVLLSAKNLSENFRSILTEAANEDKNKYMRDDILELGNLPVESVYRDLIITLQVILYICATNADIQPHNTFQNSRPRSPIIKDKYSEIRSWDVGARIGAAFRAHREIPQNPNEIASSPSPSSVHHSGTSKRPHLRRAHWHHYWTGVKSIPEERKLVLKWIPPIAIGSLREEDAPIVVHKVEGTESPDNN